MSKQRLIKRLSWYYPTEKLHTYVTVPALLIYVLFTNPLNNIVFLSYGLIVCIVILYQGQHYWKLKLHRLKGIQFDQKKNIDFFQKSKKVNFVLIGIMPIFFIIQLYLDDWNFNSNDMQWWGIAANAFAILEHVNYYHTQLMVDNQYDINYLIKNKRLKQASLAKDLIENKI